MMIRTRSKKELTTETRRLTETRHGEKSEPANREQTSSLHSIRAAVLFSVSLCVSVVNLFFET